MLPSSSLPGFSGSRNVLSPSDFSSVQRAAGALRVPPVDQPDTVEVTVRLRSCSVGDVLVVDAEHPLAQRLVRVVEQRQHGVGERQFLVDAVLVEFADAGVDVVRRRAGQVVVLHEHAAEVASRSRPCPSCRPCRRRPRTRSAAPCPSAPRGSARRRCRRPPRCGCRRRRSRCPRAVRCRPWRGPGGTWVRRSPRADRGLVSG